MWRTIHIPERDFKRSNFTASKPDGKYTINVYDSNLETIKVFRCDGYTLQVAGPGYQELRYNNSMRLGELKEHIKFFEKNGNVNDFSEVIMGKIGTCGTADGPEVQVEVVDADIQVVPGEDRIAFTLVHK